jgi:hypothetical protein
MPLDTSIYGNIQTPQKTSLGDMINLAKGGYELSKLQELYPAIISKEKALSEQAQTGSEKSKAELQNYYQLSAQGAISALQKKINSLKNADGKFVEGAQDILKNDADMVEQILLAQGVPKHPSGAMEQFKNAIAQGPDKAENFINIMTQKGGSAESRFTQANPTLTSVGGVPGFATPATQKFTPLNISQNQPTDETTTGNTNVTTQTTEQPKKIVQETFPNRANTPYVSDTEKPRFEEGTKILSDARTLGDSAKTQLNDIQNVRKYIKATTGTALGQGARTAAKLIAENPDLDSLIKSTAQLQLNAAGQLNANTDAARALLAATTGDGGNISEKALGRLLDTAEADLTAASKYATGIQNFAKKRGNTGGILNAPDFKQSWTENAKDRKIYQLININNNPEFSAAQKQMLRDDLLQHESKSSVEALSKQLKAMKQLEKGD